MNASRLYARLLRLYPREFYDRFGSEMLDVFIQAQKGNPAGIVSSLTFYTREFGGLLVSVVRQQQETHGMLRLRKLFRRRYVPVWLFAFSMLVAVIFSQNYWGYPVFPPARTSNLATIERISLVKLDDNYGITVVPIASLPSVSIPEFPPSNILPTIPQNVQIDRTLDPAFIAQVSEALAREKIEINRPSRDYPLEPIVEANGSFTTGVQPQDDGTLMVIYPEISRNGRVEMEAWTSRLTPSDLSYYSHIMPAGYIVQGRDSQGEPLVFTAIATNISGDRYRYYELIFFYGMDGLTLRDGSIIYNFDIAGLEVIASMPVVTLAVFVPLLAVWLAILAAAALIRLAGGRIPFRQSIA